MDPIQYASSEILGHWVKDVFHIDTTPDKTVLFVIVCLGIGFLALLIRYVLFPKNHQEYLKWRDENWISQVLLALLVGIFGYVTIMLASEFANATYITLGLSQSLPPLYDLAGVIVTVAYSAIWLILISKNTNSYQDITHFLKWNFAVWIPLTLLALGSIVMRNSIPLGASIYLLVAGMIFGGLLVLRELENKLRREA
jgi:hypothetical protein